MSHRFPLGSILGAIVSVQAGAALAKGLFPALGPIGTVGLRVVLSAIMLLAAFRPSVRGMTAAQWRGVIPYGLVLGTMNILFYLSLSRIPLGVAVTVEFVGPMAVAVFGSRRAVDIAWGVLAAAGIALIAPWSDRGTDAFGVALALAAGGCWAAYILLGGRVSRIMPGGASVAIGVALLSSAVPYTLEMIALKGLPARTFGILMSLEPAVAALLGVVFLHELLSFRQWLAVALIIAASTGSTMTSRRPAPVVAAEAGEGWQGG